ncbi:hypothetical protein NP493_7397g00002 [Ridgeia piscesae]|uniref:Uncharacterized protein n=1 Tax=Ridgeia piscesae TaxID=27915 RepID=A0AAD9MP37_RIDPI|nr:hypothetical protein NP493_7397g00002 [Ridgeia piscesae]
MINRTITEVAVNIAYRDILHSKLSTIHILTCDANDDSDAVQGLVDSFVVQLNDAMHNAVTEAGCTHAGAVYATYKYIKKVFRRRTRQCVDRSVNNKYQKLNVLLKNRKLSAFWNVIQTAKNYKS